MPSDLPLACSLSATEMPRRLAEIAEIGRAGLLSVASTHRATTLRFHPDPRVGERLAAIVAAEGACCSFLDLALDAEPDGLTLRITAPAGGELVMEELVAAFKGEARTA